MKKKALYGTLWIIILTYAFLLCWSSIPVSPKRTAIPIQQEGEVSTGVFRMPASLRVIGEEAFEGVMTSRVYLQDDVQKISNRAFAENSSLEKIYIPDNTEIEGRDVFSGTEQVTVCGIKDSPADEWTQEHGIPFQYQDIWHQKAILFPTSGWIILLLFMALISLWIREEDRFRIKQVAFTIWRIAMVHLKREELFVRELCFP